MNEDNPFTPPASQPELPHVASHAELASLSSRFAGAFIDGIIFLVILVPISVVIGIVLASVLDVDGLLFDVIISMVLLPLIIVVFVVLNGHLLARRGQTIGKLAVKTQIVSDQGELLPLGQLILKRYIPIWVLSLAPFIGRIVGLVDVVFIFNKDRKCLHDQIAGTKVINYRESA